MLLPSNRIRLLQPPADLRVDIRRCEQPKMVDMIASGDHLNLAETSVLHPTCQHDVPVDPLAAWRELSERHPNLKSDPGLLRQYCHRSVAPHRGEYRFEHRANNRRLAREMRRERA